jgi:hypothetical protein
MANHYKNYSTDPDHLPGSKAYYALIIGATLLAIAAIIAINSCTTSRKAVAYMDKHVSVASDYCAVRYPCKDSVHESITYREGETIVVHDSTTLTDTSYSHDTVTITKLKYQNRDIVVHDTLDRERVIYQTDKAKLAVLDAKLDSTEKAATKITSKFENAKELAKWGWGIIIAVCACIVGRWYFKSKLSKLV